MESQNITITIAFLAGLLSFLSPCVLPLVPGYVSLISGVSIDHLKSEDDNARRAARRAVIFNSIAFNIGLSMIFLALGAAAGLVGTALLTNKWIRLVGGAVIIGFGLQLIGILKIGALYKDTRFFSQQKPRGILGSFTLGMAFAAGWTPCIGPILGGIIGLAATSGGWRSGLLLSTFYAAGLAMPFLATGLAINRFLSFYTKFRRHLHKVEVVSGVILILIGAAVMTNYTTKLSSLLAWLPNAESVLKSKTEGAGGAANASKSFEPAPDVQLKTLDGQAVQLSEMRGQVVLLNFWATWCGPCRSEIPVFNEMQRDFEARGLKVVGVSTAETNDTPEMIREFQKEFRQDYTILLGGDDVTAKFRNGPGLPVTIIIDREGRIRQKIVGESNRAGFEAAIKPLLDEAPATALR
ncbi:MAG: cytochrome c-type biosis protein [Blastocatellia bacterium]|jgi:cytochrome c-type biogenesis protein|nr:cytochrome c-type biosis protein [Blastocatellia bacterium]